MTRTVRTLLQGVVATAIARALVLPVSTLSEADQSGQPAWFVIAVPSLTTALSKLQGWMEDRGTIQDRRV